MPVRSKIDTLLPEELRKRLDAKLITNGFKDYAALSKWLSAEGFEISKSAIHRHGEELERKIDTLRRATEQAKVLAREVPDDEGAINDAIIRLYQEKLFDLMMAIEVDPEKVNIASLGRTLATVARASVNQKKWMKEVRETLKTKVAAADAEIARVATSAGIAPDTSQKLRNALLGIDV